MQDVDSRQTQLDFAVRRAKKCTTKIKKEMARESFNSQSHVLLLCGAVRQVERRENTGEINGGELPVHRLP